MPEPIIPPWVLRDYGRERAWQAICPNCPAWLSRRGYCRDCDHVVELPDSEAADEITARVVPHDKPLVDLTPLQQRIIELARQGVTYEQAYHRGQRWGRRLRLQPVSIRGLAREAGCSPSYVFKLLNQTAK